MQIFEKFQQGREECKYQRIDTKYKTNIFLGYNDKNQMSMVITEKGDFQKIKSTKYINVQFNKRSDGKMALSFDLVDNHYSPVFLVFCKDMILNCERVDKEIAIKEAIIRWKYWMNLFGKKHVSILQKSEVKGLIGELIVLEKQMITQYGTKSAVLSWMGPLMGHKDYEINNTWYEVKSTTAGSAQISISSIEQLESDIDGHLVIVKLDETSPVSVSSINLNQMVMKIVDLIDDIETMDAFNIKLDSAGYMPEKEYDEINYVLKGIENYYVNERFPRIRRSDISNAIENVKYTILIEKITQFKEV